ncbi:MAG: hypothetical protein AB8G16_06495 [Gammaproteobacteria bacterium]
MRPHYFACTAAALTLAATSAAADWGWDGCQEQRDLALEFDLNGVTDIAVEAVSGDLDIEGVNSPSRIVAKGRACARERYADRIDDMQIVSERDGSTLRIIAQVPRTRIKDSLIGSLDMTLEVPDHLPITVFDSSGDTNVTGSGPLSITDSSGDLTLQNINGDINVKVDSSGDIEIRDAGNVVIDIDSSGDIEIRDALSVRIGKDSSGDIETYRIAGDVYVGADSSGDIDAREVGGSLIVERDGSGDIDYRSVAGSVDIPKNKRDDRDD